MFVKSVKSGLKKGFRYVKVAVLLSLLVIWALILSTVCLISTVLVFNPLMFNFWSMVAPKKMISIFYAGDGKDIEDVADDANGVFNYAAMVIILYFMKMVRTCLRWEVHLFPWYVKKVFISERPTEEFSDRELIRYFNELRTNEKVKFLVKKTLTGSENRLFNLFWNKYDFDMRSAVLNAKVSKRRSLSQAEIDYAAGVGYVSTLRNYASYATLSEDMLKSILSYSNEKVHDVVAGHIRQHGVSPEFISWAHLRDNKISEFVFRNLEIHQQRETTRLLRGSRPDSETCAKWRKFCEKTQEFCPQAQREFNAIQAQIFYETAAERQMDEVAVYYFFSLVATKEDTEVADVIFKNEGEKALKSERIKTLVKSNHWLNCHALGVA